MTPSPIRDFWDTTRVSMVSGENVLESWWDEDAKALSFHSTAWYRDGGVKVKKVIALYVGLDADRRKVIVVRYTVTETRGSTSTRLEDASADNFTLIP